MLPLAAFLLCLPLIAQAREPERDDYGRIKRNKKARDRPVLGDWRGRQAL